MDIIERGRHLLQALSALAGRSRWDWRRCPFCGEGETETWKQGTDRRRPWLLSGRQSVVVQRRRCLRCQRPYAEQSALLMRGSW